MKLGTSLKPISSLFLFCARIFQSSVCSFGHNMSNKYLDKVSIQKIIKNKAKPNEKKKNA